MKIMFLVRSMAVGGAQRQLSLLSRELLRLDHEVSVLLYYTGELFDAELRAHGLRVVDLKKRGRWRNLGFLLRLVRMVRAERPDVVYAYLPGPNLLALLLRCLGGGCAVVCGVRASEMSGQRVDWLTRLTLVLERQLVLHADMVIVNSHVGARYLCRGRHYANVAVIHNGVDTQSFAFSAVGRRRMRATWSVSEDTPVVGCVARLDPMKDHPTLLQAFALLRQSRPDARLICVGTFAEPYRSELTALERQLRLAGAVLWIAHESQLSDLYSGFDALCLSSAYGEGFPNVLAEAMACGVPCVATDVGDAAQILSSADYLVPRRDPRSLAQALAKALAQRRLFSELRTERIRAQFSARRLAELSLQALNAALERRKPRATCGTTT
jgi:glycosyltransferase involved in cell wall biosynthesis